MMESQLKILLWFINAATFLGLLITFPVWAPIYFMVYVFELVD